MGCLGVHFAITETDVAKLRSFDDDGELLEYFVEEFEEDFFGDHEEWLVQSDKAWDGIHRALTDGRFDIANGTYSLNHVIMGGEELYRPSDYIMMLKTPDEVRDIADAIKSIDEPKFRAGYSQIDPEEPGWEIGEEDFQYSWSYFQDIREFYQRAAQAGRYVLFTASQ